MEIITKKNKCLTLGIFVILILLGSAVIVPGQHSKTATEISYAKARQIVERSVQVLGGLKNFQAIETIAYKSTAKFPENGQSLSPDAAFYLRPFEGEGVIDLKGKRFYRLGTTTFVGGAPFRIATVINDKSGFTADLNANAAYPFGAPEVALNNRNIQRLFPYLLLRTALSRAGTLRWLAEEDYEGARQQVVTFSETDGSQVALYFNAQTGMLTKFETLVDSFLEGLASSETIFSDYRDINNVKMPFHVITKIAGTAFSDTSYNEIKFNIRPDNALFEMPKNAEIGPEATASAPVVTLKELGKDVYYVNAFSTGSIFYYSSMFVVFKDFVMVIEAPVNDTVSQLVITKIKETAPGKPIRYLAPTHYHIDHTGGIRGYIAEGSTILTTPGNQKFIQNIASIIHPLNADSLSRNPRPVQIETFKDKKVITDGEQVVELYNLGPTPHADEIVMAYLPKEKIAFVSDLFPTTYKGKIGPVSPVFIFFEKKIKEMGLQIETIANGHGRLGRMEELRKLLAESEPNSNGGTSAKVP